MYENFFNPVLYDDYIFFIIVHVCVIFLCQLKINNQELQNKIFRKVDSTKITD